MNGYAIAYGLQFGSVIQVEVLWSNTWQEALVEFLNNKGWVLPKPDFSFEEFAKWKSDNRVLLDIKELDFPYPMA
jgi:hypothetical protein